MGGPAPAKRTVPLGRTVALTGRTLTLEELEAVAHDPSCVAILSPEARSAVESSRRFVDELLASGEKIYGVTTGFGRLADVVIPPGDQKSLQRNLVRSHSIGVGRPLGVPEVRAIMALRANALARGHSGCRSEVVEGLLELLAKRVHPVVPEAGSVGASGDLAPLAHIALALIGEGSVEMDGAFVSAAEALRSRGIEPLVLREKEGLALINGTQAMTGVGGLTLLAAERTLDALELAGAMSLEGLRGTPDPFRPEVHEARGHPGQIQSAARLRSLLQNSEIRESHRQNDPRVQDPYSIRCMPQVHGAARDGFAHVRRVLTTEMNASTDNPLVFPEQRLVVSAGNFHGQIVAQALDLLAIAATDVAAISERRIERLLNPDLSGLPAFLSRSPGLESGLMMCQVVAVDLLAEMRVLAHPASVDSVPTSANQEDHVSMGMTAARKARRAVECLETIVAIELLCAAQALEFLKPLRPGGGVERAYERIRQRVPALEGDRVVQEDIETIVRMLQDGELTEPDLMRETRRETGE